jgi:hypothetical protein
MPILKIPLNSRVKGMIFLDSTPWYNEPTFIAAYRANLRSNQICEMVTSGKMLKIRVFGINYYRIGPYWPDRLLQKPISIYRSVNAGVSMDVNADIAALRVILPVPKDACWIFGNRPGMVKFNGAWTNWYDLYNHRALIWMTRLEFMKLNGITYTAQLYRGLKSGLYVSMDFLGQKNVLFCKAI